MAKSKVITVKKKVTQVVKKVAPKKTTSTTKKVVKKVTKKEKGNPINKLKLFGYEKKIDRSQFYVDVIFSYKQYGDDTVKSILSELELLPPRNQWSKLVDDGEEVIDKNVCGSAYEFFHGYLEKMSNSSTKYDIIFEDWQSESEVSREVEYFKNLLPMARKIKVRNDIKNSLIKNVLSQFREYFIIIRFKKIK